MKHDGIVFQGPFGLKQGGKGIPVRNPVYIARNGKKEFWGFTIAIIRVPDIFSNSMKALENFGYQCRLLKTTAPWSRKYVDVYHSGENLTQPVSNQFTIAGDTWKLQVMPEKGWGGGKKQAYVVVSIMWWKHCLIATDRTNGCGYGTRRKTKTFASTYRNGFTD